jgi:2-polyprenyl-3-methyl-5-hydroxy-6-metoxy-1,4-benzoquinol methylase
MSKAQRIVFEGVANDLLKELGYEAYDHVPKRLSGYAYELWCFLGRGGRFGRLSTRFGIKRRSKLERRWSKFDRTSRQHGRAATQHYTFGSLVRNGAYDIHFEHAPELKEFFQQCMREVYEQVNTAEGISILDCGCGPGAWLAVVSQMKGLVDSSDTDFFGFDLTPEMVDLARQKLAGRVPPSHLKKGDILSEDAYAFTEPGQTYNVIYAYDVVQQLPRKLQFAACETMLRHLSPGGFVVIFDHERASAHGCKMGFKKFVTKYLRIALLPRYYCNARYPALTQFARKLSASGHFATEIKMGPNRKKRALIIRSLRSGT